MVRAILDGRKSQTRRVIKPQPAFTPAQEREIVSAFPGSTLSQCMTQAWLDGWVDVACPYGKPGDRLWVRETWRTSVAADAMSPTMLEGQGWPVWYGCDGVVRWTGASTGGPGFTSPGKTRVSIHMPRWASRIELEVTEVRMQRLQEISEGDAQAEGAPSWPGAAALAGTYGTNHRANFIDLWDSINGERPGCSWDANPFVWAISFRRLP